MPSRISRNNSLEGADIWGDSGGSGSSSGGGGAGVDPCLSRSSSRPLSRSGSKTSLSGQKRSAEQDEDLGLEDDARYMSTAELRQLCSLLENDIRIMKSDVQLIAYESAAQRKKIKAAEDKIQQNSQPPLLVSNVVEVLQPMEFGDEMLREYDAEDEGVPTDISTHTHDRPSAVIKTSTRQTIFLPIPGLVDPRELRPGDLVGCNKDSYLILEKLPDEHDRRVKVMEVEDKPTESYADIAGCDQQIQELIEAVVLPMTHRDMFKAVGVKPPKGVLLYGPPGTGKTLLARACASQTNATFFKLAGPELVQMYIGDGSKMVRDAFDLAKEKVKDGDSGGVIMFIDELDAIGTKREGGDQSGEREVQRTLCELLNQLDGFSSDDMVKVIAATNRPDILDPALLRSGRLDRKIELPMPTEDARIKIFKIHSKKMHLSEGVNFTELARTCEDFNGAQIKAVCVEAGMLALRQEASAVGHECFVEACAIVSYKKKGKLDYFA
mmetsp:Transcript_20330/g.41448  ORF Transcript_20330/g.41448 Transcript_20330/m.41448 type:complete len:496 (+) Transcript_20330:110-1597(+)